MELKDDYAIVMKSDSSMVKVKLKDDMNVGEVLIFLEEDMYMSSEKKNIKNKMIVTILSIAATLALVILPAINIVNSRAYALVSLDINPSIQFELDKNQNIVSVGELNQDSIKLDLQELKGTTLEEGLKILNEKLEANGYVMKNDKIIVGFAFLSKKEDITYEKDVKHKVDSSLKDSKLLYLKGNKDDSKIAEEKGLSLGRYEAILKLEDDELEDKIENMSVEEILSLLSSKSIKLDRELREELEDVLDDKLDDDLDTDDLDDDVDNDEDDDVDNDTDDEDDEIKINPSQNNNNKYNNNNYQNNIYKNDDDDNDSDNDDDDYGNNQDDDYNDDNDDD